MLLTDVFTPTDFPKLTYVERDQLHLEMLLGEWVRSSAQIASISGPSKAGKTVLVQRVVGEGNLVTVSGASVRSADQLWERVLDWLRRAARDDDELDRGEDRDRHARAHRAGRVFGHRRDPQVEIKPAAQTDTLQATVNRRGLQVVAEIARSPTTVLLDDFHYIPAAIQADVAQQHQRCGEPRRAAVRRVGSASSG